MNWYRELVEPTHLEAPDKKFKGHRDIIVRNLARYKFVNPYIQGRTLEIGCGRGYGLAVIRSRCTLFVGLDVSMLFLRDARADLPEQILIQADGRKIPFREACFDTIIAFEVIEHIRNDVAFLAGLKRLASQEAKIIISTPNRLIASGDAKKPLDRFHVREYTAFEFQDLLERFFSHVVVYGQMESGERSSFVGRLLDHIPPRWKYILPAHIQGYLSIMLRSPLRIENCSFSQEDLSQANTLIAICQA